LCSVMDSDVPSDCRRIARRDSESRGGLCMKWFLWNFFRSREVPARWARY